MVHAQHTPVACTNREVRGYSGTSIYVPISEFLHYGTVNSLRMTYLLLHRIYTTVEMCIVYKVDYINVVNCLPLTLYLFTCQSYAVLKICSSLTYRLYVRTTFLVSIRYTEELNRLPYRQKFPRLEQKNIQFWFKNRRAKCKRMNVVTAASNSSGGSGGGNGDGTTSIPGPACV